MICWKIFFIGFNLTFTSFITYGLIIYRRLYLDKKKYDDIENDEKSNDETKKIVFPMLDIKDYCLIFILYSILLTCFLFM
jgi:hypothetical protein